MPAKRSPTVISLIARADVEEAAGNLETAHHIFEQAQRLAPDDRGISMAIGRVRLARGDPRASEPLELVARYEDLVDAWVVLAAVRVRFGFPDIARAELHPVLQRLSPPVSSGLHALMRAIVKGTDAPGWCCLSGDGALLVGLGIGKTRAGLRVMLDGVRLRPPNREGATVMLPPGWQKARSLTVEHDGVALIGSPISPGAIGRVEGFVAGRDGGLEGWAWLPADPETPAEIIVRAAGAPDSAITVKVDLDCDVEHPKYGARPRGFRVSADEIAAICPDGGRLDVLGVDGRPLYGSPIDPGLERRSAAAAIEAIRRLFPAGREPAQAEARADVAPSAAMAGVPADLIGVAPTAPVNTKRGVDIVVPVYRGVEETLACIESVRASSLKNARLVIVEDCSPEAEMRALLDDLAAKKHIVLHRLTTNRGFPGAANEGMRLAEGRDVILLNSDTLVPKGWLERLRAAAFSAPDIGSVTPFANDATIMSYPSPNADNPVPDMAETAALDKLAATTGGALIDLPTGIGFCMYIRRECLDQVGLLREDVFGQGYGEENDWCLRASAVGWRHVGLPTLFVGHVGGRSFGAAKGHLIARNLQVLERLHPGYERVVHGWVARDPAAPARRLLDLARWRADRGAERSLILLTHGRDGGVKRRVAERAAEIRAEGLRPIIIRPVRIGPDFEVQVYDGDEARYPNLRFAIPAQMDELVALLAEQSPTMVEIHHFIGHHPDMLHLPARLDVPSEVVLHDYSWFCPRINLVGAGDRYCGEPDLLQCETCIRDLGTKIDEKITPSPDTARRFRRHFPKIRPEPVAWEAPVEISPQPRQNPDPNAPVRVVVPGAIGIEKGYDVLLACARDAASRRLPLTFSLVGYSCDDSRLLDTGAVTLTGAYAEESGVSLVRAQDGDLAWITSIWPETWCYTLTLAWQAGLDVMSFDIGAPAERIRLAQRGWVVPLGLAPAAINDALVAAGRQARALQKTAVPA